MLWVGTYREKGGSGLCPLRVTDGELELLEPEPRIANASYAIWRPQTSRAYFTDEREAGRVVSWAHADGQWRAREEHASGGELPCYLSVNPAGSLLAVANYGDGAVGLIGLDAASGRIEGLADVAQSAGRGPDSERQDGPHAHCVLFDERGRSLYHVDLGLDRIVRYDVAGGRLNDREVVFRTPPGAGPRHLLLLPRGGLAVLVCELSAELMLLELGPAGFTCLHAVKTAPVDDPGEDNLGGHLALAGDGTIMVTNRGHDSLVAFLVRDRRLHQRGWVPTGGASPRHIHELGDRILVAHEESGTMTLVSRPRPGGDADPLPAASAPVPGAAFILDVPD